MSIYNESLNTIYIHIPRTGGTSVEKIISGGGHTPISDYYNFIKYQTTINWDDIFKFTFVRNPIDRFISGYYWLSLQEKQGDIDTFIQKRGELALNLEPVIFRPQHLFLRKSEGSLLTDFIGRTESMGEDWEVVSDRLGIDDNLPHVNATNVRVDLAEESREKLKKMYQKDFEIFYPELL